MMSIMSLASTIFWTNKCLTLQLEVPASRDGKNYSHSLLAVLHIYRSYPIGSYQCWDTEIWGCAGPPFCGIGGGILQSFLLGILAQDVGAQKRFTQVEVAPRLKLRDSCACKESIFFACSSGYSPLLIEVLPFIVKGQLQQWTKEMR
jgi:hypothetical protein